MARIRTIKPDFWTDGTMISLSFEARLFYIGTWNFALCDHGHLPDDALGLKLKILPADNVNAQAILDELLAARRLVRLTLPDGRTFLHIVRLDEHQKIDARWQSRCPVCTSLAETRASSGEAQGDSRDFDGTRLGGEGKGKESKGGEGAPAFHAGEPATRCPLHLSVDNPPNCGKCKDARVAHEAWAKALPDAPRDPGKPIWDPTVHCEHWQLLGSCDACAQEAKDAAVIIHGRFGAA